MNEIQTTVLTLIPPKRRHTPSGWTAFDAVCCHHNGQNRDKRRRGGLLINAEGGFQYHCFNCGFKAGWTPGKLLSGNTKKLFSWFGLSESDIGQLNLAALKIKDGQPSKQAKLPNLELKDLALPPDCLSIDQWLAQGATDPELIDVVDYVVNQRGMQWSWYPWHWSAAPGYRDRVILPFYQAGRIVGYTGRKIVPGKPKYLTDSQPGYVFNIDRQSADRQYVIVAEGQFDAIAVDGVAIMTNEPNDAQCLRINALGREVICVPDRDRAGTDLLKHAVKHNWSVSLPPWDPDVKDIADAVKRYGRLYVLATILHYRVQGEIKIQLLKNKLQAIDD